MGLDKMLDLLRNMEICFKEKGPQKEGCREKDIQKNGIQEKGFLVGKVCAVVHGGTIMALLSKFGGGEYFDYQVPCGRGYQCLLRYNRSGGPVDGPETCRAVSVSRIERI